MDGKDLEGNPAEGVYKISEEYFGELYRAGQETVLTMGLQPILLVTCKRIAFQSDTCRLSIDWDVQYYHAPISVYAADSWKYLAEPSAGRAGKVILEMKCLVDEGVPAWFSELQQRYPIWQREYLKPIEGMGFLFKGPLKNHRRANYFIPLINAYMESSLLG